jgi:hypothetical protein
LFFKVDVCTRLLHIKHAHITIRLQDETSQLRSKLKLTESSLKKAESKNESEEIAVLRDDLAAKVALVNRLRQEVRVAYGVTY